MRLAAAVALLLAPVAGHAQTQGQMTARAGTAFARTDAAMTRQWRTTLGAMKVRDAANGSRGGGFGYAAALLASQRAWLAFRDTQCVIEGGEFAGGSLQPMTMAQCKARLTTARTAQLRQLDWTK